MRVAHALAASRAMLLVSCTVEDPSDSQMEDSMRAALSRYASFAKINRAPFASTVGAFDVNVLVSEANASYAMIHPEVSGSHVVLPAGTVIVREVLDASSAIAKLTVMAKGPPGADPPFGDWWFAVTDPHGVVQAADGVPQIGPMPACQTCHLPRAADDYLFGVAAADE
jgi:hypothetical protein